VAAFPLVGITILPVVATANDDFLPFLLPPPPPPLLLTSGADDDEGGGGLEKEEEGARTFMPLLRFLLFMNS